MLEELQIFLIILIISMVLKYLFVNEYFGYLNPFLLRLLFVGVIVHELSHYVMNLAVGIRPERIVVRWKDPATHERNPHGAVESKPRSFLQAFFICLAPLYIGTWLIFLTFTIAFTQEIDIRLRIISGGLCVSILLAAAPSGQDFNNIPGTFNKSPSHSMYQVFLVFLSLIGLWLILSNYSITFPLDIFYYLSLIGIYFIVKFSFLGGKNIILKINSWNFRKPHEMNINQFTRRRYKPKKPPKLR